jgi:hypothetical protein
MRFRLHAHLRRIASGLMLLAIFAFVQQSAMIAASQALASAGSMSDPAVTLSGSVHYHNDLARHVHVHGGHDSVGHVHDTAHRRGQHAVVESWLHVGGHPGDSDFRSVI